MKIVNNIKTFLYDKNYFINVFNDKIHIYQYIDLLKLSETEIVLRMADFDLKIRGIDMHIIKMAPGEIMIQGAITDMEFKR